MVEKKSLKYHKGIPKLTKTEKEILHLLTNEFLTIKQIALRRQCSLQAIYKLIKKLKQKGAINSGLSKVEKIQASIHPSDIRLHAQEFNIKILYQDNRYQKQLKKSNMLFLDGNTIKLYKNSIEIYSGSSFIGKDEKEADKKAINYWNKFFVRLEHELSIIIRKDKSRNIKEVNHHYARGDSEVCDNAIENKEQIRVFAKEDGKLAFITDDSFGFREDETLHPYTAKLDRRVIDKQINDWRLNNPPTNTELALFLKENIKTVNDIANYQKSSEKGINDVLNKLGEQINSHLSLIQEWRKEVEERRKPFWRRWLNKNSCFVKSFGYKFCKSPFGRGKPKEAKS